MDLEENEHAHMYRCLARHVIDRAKNSKDDWGNSWNEVNGSGKKFLLEKAFMTKWKRIHGLEMYELLYEFIRCELRHGTKTISTESD